MEHIYGKDVYQSPEFRAFCERFGIAHALPSTKLTITITEEQMTVVQEYRASGAAKPSEVETTTLHNQKFRTFVPPVKRD